MRSYRQRLADRAIEHIIAEVPALLLTGPRATGKTTTASRHAKTIVRLDREAEGAAFTADPDAALQACATPVLLDEWQAVPSVLGAVKRAVDDGDGPGRFLLTGSVRADLTADTWPGTGRVVRLRVGPLTVAERLELEGKPLLDRIVAGGTLEPAAEPCDLVGYLEFAMESGFPEATLAGDVRTRRRWLESYVDQLVTRDASTLSEGRDPSRLRRYFEAYALNTAGTVTDKTLYDAAGISRKTAVEYDRLLSNLLVVFELPAWTSNRLKRLALAPKRHLVDPGLLGGILGIDTNAVLREGDLLGRTLENFVAAHLRAEADYTECRPRLHHLRAENGRKEVDIVAEIGTGYIIGIEVKATSSPQSSDAVHLAWLRDQLGDRFVKGVVLHTGPRTFELGDQIVAAPISTLWSSTW